MLRNPLLARFAACAALVAPESRDWFDACIQQAAANEHITQMLDVQATADDGFWPAADSWMARYRPYVVVDGILQIPVKGVLLHDFSFNIGSWATGYIYIWRAFERGMNDPMVKGIALVCDSPGGHVAGNFELVDKMYAMRGTKPIWGFAHEAAYSACYSIISCADPGKVWVSKTGGVGSIGVVTSHWDVSEAMKKEGYKITFIFAGKHKVDGNSYEALAPEVKDRIQVRIDALYDVFVSTVARNRGLDEQAVRDTEALTFTASEALSNGLADQIGPLDDALAAFAADLSSSEGDADMTTDTSAADQAALDTARAEGHAAGRTEGVTAGRAEGVTAERTRITAILASEEGKTRPIAALAAALDTEMTAEQAATFLGKLPAEGKTEAKSGKTLDEAMEETGGGAGVTAEGSDQGTDMVAQILANSTVATGRKYGEQKKPA